MLVNTLLLDQGWRVRKQLWTERRRVKKLWKTARYVSQHTIARSGVEGEKTVMDWEKKNKKLWKTARYVSQHSIARSGVEGKKTVMDWEKKDKKALENS